MKILRVLLFIFMALLISDIVEAQMCPSTSKFLKIVGLDENNKVVRVSAVQVPPQFFPGTEEDCPNQNIIAKMIELDVNTGVITPIILAVEKGVLGNSDMVLTDEEVKLFREKGIVNPPKNIKRRNIMPVPIVPSKGQMTASANTKSLSSSTN